MTMFLFIVLTLMIISEAHAFSLTNKLVSQSGTRLQQNTVFIRSHGRLGSVPLMSSTGEDSEKSEPTLPKIDLEKLKMISSKAIQNTKEGEFGTRGEQYFIAQAFLVLCILGGGVPLFGDFLKVLFGPVLLLVGVATLIAGVYEMGESLSPFATPSSNMTLKTQGVFQYVRHPLYAGLLCIAMGGSIVTDSASRVILTLALFFVLTKKAEFEEIEIEKKFPSYKEYRDEVTGRLVPSLVTDNLASFMEKLGTKE